MEPLQLFIAAALIVLLLEVSYLIIRLTTSFSMRRGGRLVLLDTSVLIDGRIVTIAKTGFLGGTLVIPRSVIGELQLLADTADHDKRARARYGLDVVAELQAIPHVDVEILQDGSKASEGVDERLLTLAKKHGAAICTLDYNLNKVALVENIVILNVNELAQGLRMAHLPGERLWLELVQKGQDAHQAVGYLPDGTMVVVEHASKLMGQTIEVEIIRSLQTAAGRMMFARQVGSEDKSASKKRPHEKTARRHEKKSAPQNKPSSQNKRRKTSQDAESNLINLVKNS